MRGYICADKNGECKCSGKVSYGIVDDSDSNSAYPGVLFGNWSEKKHVERSISCTEENFSDYSETEFDKAVKSCVCYPSSKRLCDFYKRRRI